MPQTCNFQRKFSCVVSLSVRSLHSLFLLSPNDSVYCKGRSWRYCQDSRSFSQCRSRSAKHDSYLIHSGVAYFSCRLCETGVHVYSIRQVQNMMTKKYAEILIFELFSLFILLLFIYVIFWRAARGKEVNHIRVSSQYKVVLFCLPLWRAAFRPRLVWETDIHKICWRGEWPQSPKVCSLWGPHVETLVPCVWLKYPAVPLTVGESDTRGKCRRTKNYENFMRSVL